MNVGHIYKSVTLLTPYFRNYIKINETIDNVPIPENNYVPYDLFTFRTKFERILGLLYPTYNFSFARKKIDGVLRLTIELYEGKSLVLLSKEKAEIFQNYINEAIKDHPGYCLLFDAEQPFKE